jgi:hypothetical protein
LIEICFSNYSQNSNLIKDYLNTLKLSNNLIKYHDLEWRIDVKVKIILAFCFCFNETYFQIKLAQRSIRNIVEPEILLNLQLETVDPNNPKEKIITDNILQTDPLNLINIANKLEEALNEIRTNYCRRVFKNFN